MFEENSIIKLRIILENFEKIFVDDVFVIGVNVTRSTIIEAKEFRKIIEEKIIPGNNRLVIDLSKCEIIDSTFFGVVILALQKMIDIGGKLKVIEPINPKGDLFTTTNTLRLFDLYKTREDAIKSFNGDF
jgi:anti-anti-sigma regulatory factor